MFRGLKARLNDSVASNDVSFQSANTSTPNTTLNDSPGLLGKFKKKLSEAVTNTSYLSVDSNANFDTIAVVTEDELMEIEKQVNLTPPEHLPDLYRKQAINRLKMRKKLKYLIGHYNDVVYEHGNLQDQNTALTEELTKSQLSESLTAEYKHQLLERSELVFQLQSQIEILKETALVPEPVEFNSTTGGAALIDISECSESVLSDTSETVRNMSYEQLYDRYQRYRMRCQKNKERLEKLSVSCQRIQKHNEKLQTCLTLSQDRAIKKISQLKETTNSAVDEHRQLVSSLGEKDERISTLQEQLHNIAAMGGFSDTESIVSEASEYNDQFTENIRRKNARLKDKVKRLEDILVKCKETIRTGIENTASLIRENDEQRVHLEHLQFEVDEVRALNTPGIEEVPHQQGLEMLIDVGEPNTPTNSFGEDASRKIADLEGLIDHYKTEESTRTNEVCQLVCDVERAKQENLLLFRELTTNTACSDELKRVVTKREEAITKLNLQVESLIKSETGLKQVIDVKENSFLSKEKEHLVTLTTLESALTTARKEAEGLKQSLQEHDVTKVMELQDMREQYSGQILLLNNKVVSLKEELHIAGRNLAVLKDSDNSLHDLMDELTDIRTEMERVNAENLELTGQLDDLNAELARLTTSHNKKLDEVNVRHEQELEEVKKLCEEKEEVWMKREGESKREVDELSEEHKSLTVDCERLATELNLMSDERDSDKRHWGSQLRAMEDSKIQEREELEELHRSQLIPFKTKIKEMQSQIHQLTAQKEEQEQEIADLTRHVFESNSDCAALTDDVTHLQAMLQANEKKLSLTLDQINNKTAELSHVTDSASTLTKKLKVSQLTLAEIQQQLDLTKSKNSTLTMTVNKSRDQCCKLEAHISDLDTLITNLKRKMEQADEEYKMKTTQLQVDMRDLVQAHDDLQAQCSELEAQNKNLTTTIASNSNGAEAIAQQNNCLQDTITQLREKTKELQNTLEEISRQNSVLSEEKKRLATSLTTQTQSQQDSTERYERELSEMKEKIELLQTEKTDELTSVRSDHTAAQDELASVRSDHSAAQDELASVRSDHTAAQDELASVRSDRAAAQDELAEMTEEFRERAELARSELNKVNTELQQHQSDLTVFTAQNTELNSQLQVLQVTHSQLQNSHSQLSATHETALTDSEHHLNQLREEWTKLQTDNDRLMRDLEEATLLLQRIQKENESVKTEMETLQETADTKHQEDLVCVEKLREELFKIRLEKEEKEKELVEKGNDRSENDDLLVKIKELETDLEIKAKSFAKDNGEHLKHIADLGSSVASLKGDLESSQTTSELLRKQSDKQDVDCRDLEKQVTEMDAGQRELSEKLEEMEVRRVELEKEVEELEEVQEKEKKGLQHASKLIGQLKHRVKEQDNRIVDMTQINRKLEAKITDRSAKHAQDLAEVQNSFMTKLERNAELENSLRLDNKKLGGSVADLTAAKADLEGMVNKHVLEKKQLSNIMKEQISEKGAMSGEIVVLRKKLESSHDNTQILADKDLRLSEVSMRVKHLQNELENSSGVISEIEVILEKYRLEKGEIPDNDNKAAEKSPQLPVQFKALLEHFKSSSIQSQTDLQKVSEHRNQLKSKLVELKKKEDVRISVLKTESESACVELEKSTLRVAELESVLGPSREEMILMKTQISSLEESSSLERERLINELTSSDNKLIELSAELEAERQELLETQHTLSRLQNQHSTTTGEVNQLRVQLEEEQLQHSRLHNDVISQHQVEVQCLEKKLCERLAEGDLNSENEVLVSELKIKLLYTEEFHDKALLEIQAIHDQSKVELQADIERLEALVEAKSSEILKLESDLESRDEQLRLSSSALETSQDNHSALQSQHQLDVDALKLELEAVKEELASCQEYLDRYEHVQYKALETEQNLRSDIERLDQDNILKTNNVTELQDEISCLKSDIENRADEKESLSLLCAKFKTKINDIEKKLQNREEDSKTLQQDNMRLSSHAKNLEICFSSLKEEKNKIVESLSQMDTETARQAEVHRAELADLQRQHSRTMEDLNSSLNDKVQKASLQGAQNTQNILQNQIRKLEMSLVHAQNEADQIQSRHAVTVSECSAKLLNSERKIQALQSVLSDKDKDAKTKESELSEYKSNSIPTSEHDEIVFNLEMAYNMSMQEQKDTQDAHIKELESHLASDTPHHNNTNHHPNNDNVNSSELDNVNSSELDKLRSQLQALTKQHKTAVDTIKNEALFSARQDFDTKLRHMRESIEQKHYNDMNDMMEDNSKERQRLLKEMEVLRKSHPRSSEHPLNTSAGRISVSSDSGSEMYLLDTEFEYLRQILYKYLQGEHTEQLLKVILVILRFTEREKVELLSKLKS